MPKIISVSKLNFAYPAEEDQVPSPVLRDVSLEIEEGEFIAILGHNGCGKSTLAKHFNGVLKAESGEVVVLGMDAADDNNLLEIRKNVGMVFQNPDNQIIATVVDEDVAFALENLGVPYPEMVQRVDEALE
ncbi:MAG: ATP-binding cassette domain-containing protein, partial [Clostridia bacterium]|nr:ATP-binding cassette domain-containing protein [Clostridia bacterium]